MIFPSDILTEASFMTLWIVTTPGWLVNPIPHGYCLAGAFASGVAAGVLWWVWRGARGSSRGLTPANRGATRQAEGSCTRGGKGRLKRRWESIRTAFLPPTYF